MKDLKLDFLNKTVIDSYVDNKQRAIQQIRLAVQTWLEDWALDETFGVDYDRAWYSAELMEFYIRKQILQVSGVTQISYFSIEKLKDDNNFITFYIKAEIVFDGETIEYKDEVAI